MDNFNNPIDIILNLLMMKFKDLKETYGSIDTRISGVWSSKWSNYIRRNKEIIVNDVRDEVKLNNKYIEIVEQILKIDKDSNESNRLDRETTIRILVVSIHVFHKLNMMALPDDKQLNDEGDLEKFIQEDNYWFRGQAHYKWKLLPSYYRSFDNKDISLDYNYLKNDYSNLGIIDKIEAVFKNKNLDYSSLSFIQHTLAFTPLLDFTKDIYKAVSFAVGNYQTPRLLKEEAAAVYAINKRLSNLIDNVDDANQVIHDFKTEYIGSKATITKIISSPFWNDFMLGKRTSKIHMINLETNDRMRIQSGTFVLFDNVLFVGDIMVVSFDQKAYFSSIVSKYKINSKSRNFFYNVINEKYPKYQFQMLLYPYDFMQR